MKSKVAVIKCDSYDLNKVYDAISRAIELIGGIENLIPKTDKILLKPNILNKANPKKAVTTHPAVFESVIKILQEKGYKNCFYGDSPGNPMSPEKIAEVCGLKQIGDKYNLTFGDFNHGKTYTFSEGKFTKRFELSNAALEADSIINICKMKTHALMRITGAVKNTLGCVYAFNKAMSHSKFPNTDDFGKMIVDLSRCLNPKLHIMDGILAMEGNGPFSGDPVPMNVIIVSTDPVALDSIFCRLVDVEPTSVPSIKYGEEFGLGVWKEEDIEVVGDYSDDLINKNFKVSKEPLNADKWQNLALLRSFFIKKPVIIKDKCVKCGACVEACPIKDPNGQNSTEYKKNIALYFNNENNNESKEKETPVYNYKNCIRCYCCQEMCPAKAIEVKTPLLGKLFIYR
ncbi:DUF362 domain-containing protein [Anaerovorax odorimutans]|uniref:DUF362 domain-containing protein n=1 Tax=Anaerovorax odorimutans TaxID=109327 RepID=UPI00040EE71E|nr:DUF362 domain-containing protein [Anaerovorax odorimutans]